MNENQQIIEKIVLNLEMLNSSFLRLLDALSPVLKEPDWSALAYRWRVDNLRRQTYLEAIYKVNMIDLDDLLGIVQQKAAIVQNIQQFIQGFPANNILLTGSRGTGKSSLARALLQRFHFDGLRLIEVDKEHLQDLADIVAILSDRHEKYLIYCDDLSFDADDASYKSLKVALDGSLSCPPDNVLILATSNRRHLMPEFFSENKPSKNPDTEEIHPNESSEEKVSLSERFGLWLSFPAFDQDTYLQIVTHWLKKLSNSEYQEDFTRSALQWAQSRGSRSGRVAIQFAKHWLGQNKNGK